MNNIKHVLIVIVLVLFLVLVGMMLFGEQGNREGEQLEGSVQEVSAEEFSVLLEARDEAAVLLDVRTPEEYAEGHIEGFEVMNYYDEDFAEQLGELDPTVTYFVHCKSGRRSGEAIDLMQELGFENVIELDGGIDAWIRAGYPVITQ